MKKTLTIIDTFGFLFRSYYALPPLKSKTGFPTGMLTGFMNFIANIGKDFQTDYLIFALDSKGDTFRNKLYPLYKANRSDVPDDLLRQLPVVIDFIDKMGFANISKIGYEADDVIASLSNNAKKQGLKIRIVSHDKDLYQLIEDDISMFDPIKKNEITKDVCFDKYGVYPHEFTNYQALLGDSSDNIPGVKGVGAKTAMALIQKYKTLDNIYKNLANIEKERWKKLLVQGKDMAYLSHKLVTLDKNICDLDNLKELKLPNENPILRISELLQKYDMHSIIKKVFKDGTSYKTNIPKEYKPLVKNNEYNINDIKFTLLNDSNLLLKIVNNIKKDDIVAFDTETTGLDSKNATIVGFSFCFESNKAYYVPINHFYLGVPNQINKRIAIEVINILNSKRLVFQNFKYDFEIIKNNFDIELKLYADTMIMSWLLNSDQLVGLDKLSEKYFDYEMVSFKDIVKKNETFANIDLEVACKYASEDAWITYLLYKKLLKEYNNNQELLKIAKNIEFPFISVLQNMQNNGIKIDIKNLEIFGIKNQENLNNLIQDIYSLSGTQFNINSPKQLGEILFNTLGLPPSKKTKTGYSTNEAVLVKLKNKHPIVDKLLEYRELYKLHSTYINPILELAKISNNNRIYTSFLQTGTATGRLSSKNPNLQNIPTRTNIGREIRKNFIPKDGFRFVGIDYSQIELRLLAHFSKDPTLVKAFQNKEDIHYQTAATIFGDSRASDMRNVAKTINFGLIYGMGSKKLSETLNITYKEAKSYIESYFKNFSTVKDYLKSIEEEAIKNNCVKTLIGRYRHFNFENANNFIKATYLREAVNTVFQGSASDLIKLSMNKIYKKYSNNSDIKMLLQIHDELIFEIKDEKIEQITKNLEDIMVNIFNLDVPLEVSVSIGDNWAELK